MSGRQAPYHFTTLHPLRGIRGDHTSRDEESTCSAAESFLCSVLSLPDPQAAVLQKLAHHRRDLSCLLFLRPDHRLAETQGLCRTSPPPNETSITINLQAGAAKSCSANRYGASQFRYWYPDKTNPRRRGNLKVFVVNTLAVFFFRSFCWKRCAANGLAKEAWRWQELASGQRLQQMSARKIEMRSSARQWRVIAENNSKEGNWHLSKQFF